MRTVWALKVEFQENRTTGRKGEKVQRLASSQEWPGVVLSGVGFYNLDYVKGIKSENSHSVTAIVNPRKFYTGNAERISLYCKQFAIRKIYTVSLYLLDDPSMLYLL